MALALVLVLVGSPTDRFDVGWFSCHRLADYLAGWLSVWVSGCLGVWVSACLSSCCQVSKVSELKKNVYRTAASRESKLIDFVGGIER